MIFDFGKLWQKSYVGMIIHSTTLESEEAVKAMYGGKKWEKVGGQFLIGDDYKKTTQGSSTIIGGKYLAGATGGSETVSLNIKQIPSHTHSIGVMTSQKEAPNMGLSEAGLKTGGGFANRLMVSGGNYNVSSTGSSQEHNNMPPYKVVYIWEGIRSMSRSEFYRSRSWREFVELLKIERTDENGFIICAHCGKPIVKKYDCIGHHKEELTEENYENPEISLNPDNVVLVHQRCHNLIHDKLGYIEKKVYIVYGSPLSGKSSYVKSLQNEGDLIVDIDNIWQALSGCERYIKPLRLRANVFQVRDALIEQVKHRTGKWSNAYIIGGYPFEAERNRLADMLGARLIHIDTSKEECLERLEYSEDGRDKKEWSKYIEDWWLQFEGGF